MNIEFVFGLVIVAAMVCVVAIVAVVFGREFRGELKKDSFTIETEAGSPATPSRRKA